MSKPLYSICVAQLVSDQLDRFVLLMPHQLVAHVPNLDFWTDEARHALATLDGHTLRNQKMRATYKQMESEASVPSPCPISGEVPPTPPPELGYGEPRIDYSTRTPRKPPTEDIAEARNQLIDSWIGFLIRLIECKFITPETAIAHSATVGLTLYRHDFECPRAPKLKGDADKGRV